MPQRLLEVLADSSTPLPPKVEYTPELLCQFQALMSRLTVDLFSPSLMRDGPAAQAMAALTPNDLNRGNLPAVYCVNVAFCIAGTGDRKGPHWPVFQFEFEVSLVESALLSSLHPCFAPFPATPGGCDEPHPRSLFQLQASLHMGLWMTEDPPLMRNFIPFQVSIKHLMKENHPLNGTGVSL